MKTTTKTTSLAVVAVVVLVGLVVYALVVSKRQDKQKKEETKKKNKKNKKQEPNKDVSVMVRRIVGVVVVSVIGFVVWKYRKSAMYKRVRRVRVLRKAQGRGLRYVAVYPGAFAPTEFSNNDAALVIGAAMYWHNKFPAPRDVFDVSTYPELRKLVLAVRSKIGSSESFGYPARVAKLERYERVLAGKQDQPLLQLYEDDGQVVDGGAPGTFERLDIQGQERKVLRDVICRQGASCAYLVQDKKRKAVGVLVPTASTSQGRRLEENASLMVRFYTYTYKNVVVSRDEEQGFKVNSTNASRTATVGELESLVFLNDEEQRLVRVLYDLRQNRTANPNPVKQLEEDLTKVDDLMARNNYTMVFEYLRSAVHETKPFATNPDFKLMKEAGFDPGMSFERPQTNDLNQLLDVIEAYLKKGVVKSPEYIENLERKARAKREEEYEKRQEMRDKENRAYELKRRAREIKMEREEEAQLKQQQKLQNRLRRLSE